MLWDNMEIHVREGMLWTLGGWRPLVAGPSNCSNTNKGPESEVCCQGFFFAVATVFLEIPRLRGGRKLIVHAPENGNFPREQACWGLTRCS